MTTTEAITIAGASLTDWLSAIGTVGALLATVALFWLDQRRRRKLDECSQAVLVSAWTEPVASDATERPVLVANLSDEPVYQVVVFGPGMGPKDADYWYQLTVLPPHTTPVHQRRRDPARKSYATLPVPQLAFTDRHGRRWWRDSSGALSMPGPDLIPRTPTPGSQHHEPRDAGAS